MENRIREILSAMTLEDKISLCNGKDFWQSKAMEQYGIPSFRVSDGPHGMRVEKGNAEGPGERTSEPATCFPTAVTSSASFDRELLYEEGKAIGEEGLSFGIDVVLGPGVNIKRDPRCGRNFEYFSEDPYLSGELGSAWVKGAESTGIGTCVKHLAANNQEYKRLNGNSQVDERTLRELYLPAFETVVKNAHPVSVMAAYPMLNGVHCSENEFLLKQVLREEWGFDGLVITDWGALCDRVRAIAAGCDLTMPGGSDYMEDLAAEAVRSGSLPEAAVDACAGRVIRMALQAAQLEKKESFDKDRHDEIARKVAEGGAVLLKNEDGILPLNQKDIVLIGKMAEDMRYQGLGSSHIVPTKLTSLRDAMPEVPYVPCCDGNGEAKDLSEAIRAAKRAKIAVVCAGLPESYEAESADRENLNMPAGHVRMIQAVAEANPNTVVVLFGGSAVAVPWISKVKAVLYMGLPGQAGGQAAANLLTGKVNPSGRLTESWPLQLMDVPDYETFGKKYTYYSEGLYVGYRYYQKAGVPVRFPFGYGLSYTSFSWSDLKADRNQVSVTIANTGKRAGAEVVQLYIEPPQNGLYRPLRELKGFEKVYLEPGEKKEVSFALQDRSFAVWSDGWKVPGGNYRISLGASSEDFRLSAEVMIAGEEIAVPSWQAGSWYEHLKGRPRKQEFEQLYGGPVMKEPEIRKGGFTMEMTIMEMKEHSLIMKTLFQLREREVAKQFGGKKKYGDPAFRIRVMSATDEPFRVWVINSGGTLSPDWVKALLALANGTPDRILKKK